MREGGETEGFSVSGREDLVGWLPWVLLGTPNEREKKGDLKRQTVGIRGLSAALCVCVCVCV